MNNYPRVLVVNGGPFERYTNHGIVMSSLFHNWPKDRLAIIEFAQTRGPEFDVCEQCWRVTRSNILRGMMGKATSGVLHPRNPQRAASQTGVRQNPDLRTSLEHWLRKIVPSLEVRTVLNEIYYRLPAVLSRSLRRWIDQFKPDLVFSMLGTGALLHINLKISRIWNVPCVPYFTDDWISWLYRDHLMSFWLRPSLERLFHQYLSRMPIGLTVSTDMASEFTKRYAGTFSPILYPYDSPHPEGLSVQQGSSERVRFIYLGGFEPDRWRSLQMLGRALAKLDQEGVRAELLIYAFPQDIQTHGEKLRIDPVSRIMGTATPAEVPGIQQSADVLVHVESFDPLAKIKTGLSFSTKIPQYLSSKKCVLAFGPADVASMHYLTDTQAAFTFVEDDLQHLADALRKLILSADLREQYAERGFQIAHENHNGEQQRELLRSRLQNICNAWKSSRSIDRK